MKTMIKIGISVVLCVVLFSCNRDVSSHLQPPGAFISTTADTLPVARPITYDVIIRNPVPEDAWKDSCLANMDQQTLIDFVFSALYSGKITAYDFYTNKALSVRKVRKIEEEIDHDRDRMAKIQFTENWYLDTLRMTLDKKVTSMMFGYELYDNQGKVRGYRAAFRINLKEK